MYGTSERPLRTVYIDLADTTAVERTSEVHSAVVAIELTVMAADHELQVACAYAACVRIVARYEPPPNLAAVYFLAYLYDSFEDVSDVTIAKL
jgi:hypothetical protein